MERLNKLQLFYRNTYREIYVDVKFDKYQFVLRRQMLSNRIRDKWILLHGGRESASCHNTESDAELDQAHL